MAQLICWECGKDEKDCECDEVVKAVCDAAFKAGKKEGVWAVTEYLDVYDDDGYCRICNHLNYADWQEFLKGLEG